MRTARMVGACVCALTMVGAAAPPAQAGTITIKKGREGVSRENGFWVTYAGGELANDVTATWDPVAKTYTITDRKDVILPFTYEGNLDALSMCTYTLHTAVCTQPAQRSGAHLILSLGGGNDRAVAHPVQTGVDFEGGAGNDTLTVTGTGLTLFMPGAGNDVVNGGAGTDWVLPSAGGDRVSGGAGEDWLTYSSPDFLYGDGLNEPSTGVHISVDGVADDGQPGEGDNVLGGFERVTATHFDDVVAGGPAAESLDAGYGNDRLSGGAGQDVLGGGDGDDEIDARDGEADSVSCGWGTDLAFTDPFDLAGSCETVQP